MIKMRFLAIVALVLPIFGRTTFAAPTPKKYELCRVDLNVTALLDKTGRQPSPLKVSPRFNQLLTDFNPPKPVLITPPVKGPWVYTASIRSEISQRRFAGLIIEPNTPAEADSRRVAILVDRTPAEDAQADSPFKCADE